MTIWATSFRDRAWRFRYPALRWETARDPGRRLGLASQRRLVRAGSTSYPPARRPSNVRLNFSDSDFHSIKAETMVRRTTLST
jgi:hypothetical protein